MLAAMASISGEKLTDEEKSWLERNNPLGVTLFSRNLQNLSQIKKLTTEIREVIGRENVLIAVDQEGGRVRRLNGSDFYNTASQYVIGQLNEDLATLHAQIISSDLYKAGINLNYAPVLDMSYPETHPVLKSRCLGTNEQKTALLGKNMIETYIKNGIVPCVKHMPGHGRATVDPHLGLPVIINTLSELSKDFYPFIENNNCPFGMTAHIVVKEVDDKLPITLSPKGIDYLIRGVIGFDGLLISDSIDMKALSGTIGDKAQAVMAAGCDVVCYCGGKIEELYELEQKCPQMSERSLHRLEDISKILKHPFQGLTQEQLKRYNQAVGLVEEYDERYDATEVLNRMTQKGISR